MKRGVEGCFFLEREVDLERDEVDFFLVEDDLVVERE